MRIRQKGSNMKDADVRPESSASRLLIAQRPPGTINQSTVTVVRCLRSKCSWRLWNTANYFCRKPNPLQLGTTRTDQPFLQFSNFLTTQEKCSYCEKENHHSLYEPPLAFKTFILLLHSSNCCSPIFAALCP